MDYFNIGQNRIEIEKIVAGLRANNKHYVYILHRSCGKPFYVGKGQNNRLFQHEVEAKGTSKLSHKLNIIRTGQSLLYSIPAIFETHEDAILEERRLISHLGRYDQNKNLPLTNQTDGGEGCLNPSEESKEKHRQTLAGLNADDQDVALANKFLADFVKVDSNPIKSVKKYKNSISTLHKNRTTQRGMTLRNAGAVVAMAVAQSELMQPNAELWRRFSVDKVDMILENGCGRNMLVNGMIELVDHTPKYERIKLTEAGFNYIIQQYSREKLISFGILQEL